MSSNRPPQNRIVDDWWKWLLFVGMCLVLVATFLWLPMVQRPAWDAATNGWKPEPWPLFRIMIFHVPMSWVATLAFLLATIHSIQVLRTGSRVADLRAVTACELGLLFGIMATVTGSIWARYEWGSFWNWDPRQTSILVLILIYGAYFALRSAIPSEATRARLSAVYAILAFLLVPFLVFIVPRMVESLHPAPIFDRRGTMQMDGELLVVFLASLALFTLLFGWLSHLKVSIVRARDRW